MQPFRGRGPGTATLVVTIILLLVVAVALLTGCELPSFQSTPAPDVATDTPGPLEVPTAKPTDAAFLQTAEATPLVPSALGQGAGGITLTVWTTEVFSPTQAITSGLILAQQVASFEETNPDVRIQFVLKKPYGKGGILDYLLTTEAVVPALLPDVVFIDADELNAAVQAEVVQALDDLVSPELVADLYPFARLACTFDGRLYGLQFQADLDHMVYNTGKLTIPPRSWPGVLSNLGPYIFPAGGQAGLVNDDFLIQYLAVRQWPLDNNSDEPFLDAESLTAVLQFYQDGVSRGVFPTEILNYHSDDDCWRDYLAGEATMTHVSAHRYLADREQVPNSAMAPIPAIDGAGAPISRGWVLALVASDPARQSLAVEFMTQLMSPETNASWNEAANYLPTRQAALADGVRGPQPPAEAADTEDSYTRFARQQLQMAQPRPRFPMYTQVAAALQKAVQDTITGSATPEEAAAQTIESAQ
jgi:ABC-type glycerol-3-phosphate transport system substrate-binding protein